MAGTMTFEANLVPAGHDHRVRTAAERERAFTVAAKHTKLVGILRKTLPVLAVIVLFTYFISTHLSVTVGDMTASISGIEISDGNLRMVNPTLKGSNKENGKYVIAADWADQDVKNPKIIKLNAIKADVANPNGGWSRMTAKRGVFDSTAERLVMQDKITVATDSGVDGELRHATLDMKTQTLRSHLPVFFNLPNGKVTARAMKLRSDVSELTFLGKVHVHLVKPPKEEGKTSASPKPEGAVPAAEAALPPPEAAAQQMPAVAEPVSEAAPAPQTVAPSAEVAAPPPPSGITMQESGMPELPPMPQ
ncbi:MAG: hypothetical protein FJX44_01345 [Alphaproteobacteria bacterium]|nr:hypothetical protein [Alphaproteobacteria bacterium]